MVPPSLLLFGSPFDHAAPALRSCSTCSVGRRGGSTTGAGGVSSGTGSRHLPESSVFGLGQPEAVQHLGRMRSIPSCEPDLGDRPTRPPHPPSRPGPDATRLSGDRSTLRIGA